MSNLAGLREGGDRPAKRVDGDLGVGGCKGPGLAKSPAER